MHLKLKLCNKKRIIFDDDLMNKYVYFKYTLKHNKDLMQKINPAIRTPRVFNTIIAKACIFGLTYNELEFNLFYISKVLNENKDNKILQYYLYHE